MADFIGFVVFGLVVGVLARIVIPGRQHIRFGTTLLLGLIGSVVGGIVASALDTGDLFELNVLGGIVAVAAAVVLIVIGDRFGRVRRRFDGT